MFHGTSGRLFKSHVELLLNNKRRYEFVHKLTTTAKQSITAFLNSVELGTGNAGISYFIGTLYIFNSRYITCLTFF